LLRSAPAAGAVLIGLWLAHRPVERPVGRVLFLAVAIYGLATIAFGLSESFALSLALLAVMGASDQVSVVLRNSLMQIMTPDGLRGRVAAAHNLATNMSNQIGRFEAGLAAAWLGPVPAVVVGGLITLGVVAGWAMLFPSLRRIERL
jgi:MFS family permease